MKRAPAVLLAALLGAAACTKPHVPDAGAVAAAPDAGPRQSSPEWADGTLKASCQGCHALKVIEQQRLTAGQWAAVLKKMKGWGATIDDEQIEPFAAELAARRGPAAPLPAPAKIDAAAAADAFTVLDDGPLAGGDAAAGLSVFQARCGACHGADARGAIGVNLVDRLMLQRAPDFAAYVRQGRGLMPPQSDLGDAQLGQVLAWLRTL